MQKILRERGRHNVSGVPRRTWDREEAAGRAPRRVRLTEHTVGWIESEVLDWVAARVAERDDAAA